MYSILNNGVKFPLLGLGTYRLRTPEVEVVVRKAIEQGYKLIDTASGYGNENQIGDVLKNIIPGDIERSDIFVTSKLGPESHGKEHARKAVYSSLKNLQLDFLDLYLIHWPGAAGIPSNSSRNSELRKESWIELEKLYFEGHLKAIGVSNYTVDHLKELLQYCTVTPAVLQVEIHPYLIQHELRQFCKQSGIHVQAYSSFGSAEGCHKVLQIRQEHKAIDWSVLRKAQSIGDDNSLLILDSWSGQMSTNLVNCSYKKSSGEHLHYSLYDSLAAACCKDLKIDHLHKSLLADPTVVKIAKEVKSTCAQVLLKWALQHDISVIPKTANPERLKENICISNISLSEEQIQKLNKLDKGHHFCWEPQNIK